MGIPFLSHTIMPKLSPISSSSSQFSLSSNPLFSTIFTLYILILLYFPQLFFNFVISPLFISTLILLLALLRLATSQQCKQQQPPSGESTCQQNQTQTQNDHNPEPETEPILVDLYKRHGKVGKKVAKLECNTVEANKTTLEPDPRPEQPATRDPGQLIEIDIFANHDHEKEDGPLKSCGETHCLGWAELEPTFSPKLFLEWDVGAPLEVIYEAYEGEEEGEEAQNDSFLENKSCNKAGILVERYPSLSRYYPESDSDSDMDSDCSSSTWLDEEEEREGLIEIALDYDNYKYGVISYDNSVINMIIMKPNNKVVDHEQLHFDDEDSLIEIDISPTKNVSDFSW